MEPPKYHIQHSEQHQYNFGTFNFNYILHFLKFLWLYNINLSKGNHIFHTYLLWSTCYNINFITTQWLICSLIYFSITGLLSFTPITSQEYLLLNILTSKDTWNNTRFKKLFFIFLFITETPLSLSPSTYYL